MIDTTMKPEIKYGNQKLHDLFLLLNAETVSSNPNINSVASVMRDALDEIISLLDSNDVRVANLNEFIHAEVKSIEATERSFGTRERKIERLLNRAHAKFREIENLQRKMAGLDSSEAIKDFMSSVTIEEFDPEALTEENE